MMALRKKLRVNLSSNMTNHDQMMMPMKMDQPVPKEDRRDSWITVYEAMAGTAISTTVRPTIVHRVVGFKLLKNCNRVLNMVRWFVLCYTGIGGRMFLSVWVSCESEHTILYIRHLNH